MIALGLSIMVGAGIWYLFRRQDMQIERYKKEYRDNDDEDDNGSLRI